MLWFFFENCQLGGPRIAAGGRHAWRACPPGRFISAPRASPEPPGASLEPSGLSWSFPESPRASQSFPEPHWSLPEPDWPASKLVPGDFQQHNHHKIITRSLRILIETLLKPPATFPDVSGSATALPGPSQECFWTGLRTLDSGLWTPDSFSMSHNASAVAGSPLCGALDSYILYT